MSRELLKQALDALNNLGSMSDRDVIPYAWHSAKAEAVCSALREALAQPEAEMWHAIGIETEIARAIRALEVRHAE